MNSYELFIAIFIGITLWTLILFRKNYMKQNEEYDKTRKLYRAKIISYRGEFYDDNRYIKPGERLFRKSDYFVDKKKRYSNSAIIEIIDTKEQLPCIFGHLVTEKRYPKDNVINVYIGMFEGKREARSEDYPELFSKKRGLR